MGQDKHEQYQDRCLARASGEDVGTIERLCYSLKLMIAWGVGPETLNKSANEVLPRRDFQDEFILILFRGRDGGQWTRGVGHVVGE